MSMFVFVYLIVVSLLVIFACISFCIDHPETAKIICLAVVFVSLFLVSIVYVPTLAEETDVYPLTAIVTNINYEDDLVVVEDGSGFIWCFYGIEDYQVGDVVSMLMWEAGTTDNIKDDEILDVIYSGFRIDMF